MARFALQLPAELPRAADLTLFLDRCADTLGLDRARRNALQLCGEEVFANIAMHGTHAGPVRVDITLEGEGAALCLVFEDDAPAFDPTRVGDPRPAASLDEMQVGGRGLLLVRRFSAAQHYRHAEGRNRLELRFGADEARPGG
jgi:anti-sigma regulatory factor (Ser/Thr protein kinase)